VLRVEGLNLVPLLVLRTLGILLVFAPLPIVLILIGIPLGETEFFIDNLVVRIHFIFVMIRWTGLAPWEFEFSFPGSLTSTFLASSSRSSWESFQRLLTQLT